MKIRPVEAKLLHAERGTEMTQLVIAFAILRVRRTDAVGNVLDETSTS
jgi:hypothetical protein